MCQIVSQLNPDTENKFHSAELTKQLCRSVLQKLQKAPNEKRCSYKYTKITQLSRRTTEG